MQRLLYILIALSGLAFAGCKKDLAQQPISDLSSELFWKTAEHARSGNAAIYDGIQKTLNGNYTDWGDARSDNFTYGGTGENQINVVLNGLNATTPGSNWNNLFVTISRANFAIKYLPGIADLSEVTRNNYLAQAYAIRAYMYFYGIKVWGDLPVRLIPYENIDEDPNLARTSVDSILNSIVIPDLLKAFSLADKNAAVNVWELNTGAMLSILTDVYLWKKDYAKVIETTNQLIALNRYSLAPTVAATPYTNYKLLFVDPANTTIKENIWSLHWNWVVDGGNGIGSKIGSSSNTSNYYIDSVPLLKWENNKIDIRRSIAYDTTIANALQRVIQVWKFAPVDPTTNKPKLAATGENESKLPLYRWADILLMRAEALNWANNDKPGAFALLNQIRTRARAAALDPALYTTQLDVEKAILDERQLELFGEGKRWFDLVRTGRALTTMDPLIRARQRQLNIGQTGFTDGRKILWPISRDALTRNPLLKQNPPYSD